MRPERRSLRSWFSSPVLPWVLLVFSLCLHPFVMSLGNDGFRMIDLRVYVAGPQHLADGTLYSFLTPSDDLPFTYPPFAALTFWPLAQLPWAVTAVLWQLLCLVTVAASIYLTLRLLGKAGPAGEWSPRLVRGVMLIGSAIALWVEPVRTTFNYGQINLLLMAVLLWGAVATKDWVAGLTVGLTGGIKLIPAVTGLFYLLSRRLTALTAAVVTFLATVLLCALVVPDLTRRYFTELIFEPERTGVVAAVRNQSLRGAIDRITGADSTALWAVAAVGVTALGIGATVVCLRAGDRVAAFLAVQFIGLEISPISWNHHWVWVLPLLLWCWCGPQRTDAAVQWLAGIWAVTTLAFVMPFVSAREAIAREAGEPLALWLKVLSAVYPVLGIATLLVLLVVLRRAKAAASLVRADA